MHLYLVRTDTGDQGTFGQLYDEDRNFLCFTLERPWRDNRVGQSCIPVGTYELEPWNSRKFPGTLHVLRVDGRTAILIHWGNYGGDTEKGYRAHCIGCILVAKARGVLEGQQAILSSRPTVRRVVALEPTAITITEA